MEIRKAKKKWKEEKPFWSRELEFKLPHHLRILVGAVALLFVIGTGGYMVFKGEGVYSAFLDAVLTLAFAEVAIPNTGAQFVHTFIAVLGIIVIWWASWTTLDFIIEGRFSQYFREAGTVRRVRKMKSHYIVCGAGRVGEHVAQLMHAKGLTYVIIDNNEKKVKDLQERGVNAVYGDALFEQSLEGAGLRRAKAVISALPDTEKNIMVCLTAREISPKIKIYARAERHDLIKRLRKAGADVVVMPEAAGAEEMFHHLAGRAKSVSALHV